MAEVKEDDGDGFTMACQEAGKRLDLCFRNAVFEQLFRVFGEGVQASAKNELAPPPAGEDFNIWAAWMGTALCGQQHVRIQDSP
jgi:hypothetical protein